ncbi:MAG: nucleoside-diphosphate kinase [Oligoflexales bacterium]
MSTEKTLSILKPDATRRNLIGKIIAHFEESGLRVAAMKKTSLSQREAEGFYAEHKERPFFGELVDFMTSGPVVIMALEGENAITRNREIMGATNPAEAAEGTLRKLYAESIGENTVHGSDSSTAAAREISYFFPETDIV